MFVFNLSLFWLFCNILKFLSCIILKFDLFQRTRIMFKMWKNDWRFQIGKKIQHNIFINIHLCCFLLLWSLHLFDNRKWRIYACLPNLIDSYRQKTAIQKINNVAMKLCGETMRHLRWLNYRLSKTADILIFFFSLFNSCRLIL